MEKSETLFALAVGIVPTKEGVVLKRGCTELRINGSRVEEVVRKVLSLAGHKSGVPRERIYDMFDASERLPIKTLIDQLILRRIILTEKTMASSSLGSESNADIFYWHFDTTQSTIEQHIGQKRIIVLGVNELSRHLINSLSLAGFKNAVLIEHPLLNNPAARDLPLSRQPNTSNGSEEFERGLPSSVDCIVATSDFGMTPVLMEVNKWCIQHQRNFFPVVLHNMVGYLGPLVIPGETPCYECLQRRMNSHLEEPEMHRATQECSVTNQAIVGFHPLMISVLADFAAFDLLKFYAALIEYETGSLVEVRLLGPRVTARKVLKVPRCPSCSPIMSRPSVTVKTSMFTFAEPDA